MNYLEMVQRLAREAGEAKTSAVPSSVLGQVGILARLCDYVQQAWIDIQQQREDWDWMRTTTTFNTVASQQEYSPTTDMSLTDFGWWRKNSFKIYLSSAGVSTERFLTMWEYQDFWNYFLLGSRRITDGNPTIVAISPSKTLLLGLRPNDVYVVTGDYYKNPVTLSANSDTPACPSRYHMGIVYRALMMYAEFESAGESYQKGLRGWRQVEQRMMMDQTPPMRIGHSMI